MGEAAAPPRHAAAAAAAVTRLRAGARGLLDLCVPPGCPLCGADGDPPPGRLTPECGCVATFADPAAGWCAACGASLGPHVPDAADCHHCRGEDRFPFAGVVSLGLHEDALRDAVLLAKSPPGRPAARSLGEALLDARGDVLRGWGVDVVTAVPHHWRDASARGFAPPAELAATLARGLGARPAPRLLRKTARTAKQASLTPTDRRANLRSAFAVRTPAAVAGRRVLLCDDVLTTGTTARRCARALRNAGAAAVFVAVFARGVGR